MSSIAPSTSSQPRAMISAIACQRLAPALPVKCSIPPDTVPRAGLPLKNFDTAASSHTDPMDDTMARTPATAVTDSSVGFSDTSSSTATRSNCLSFAGSNLCACAVRSRVHAGWSVRSLSSSDRTKATRSATEEKTYRSSSLPRKASHSSPESRQRGAHTV